MLHPHLYRHPADGNEMILIPAGKSLIGSSADDPDASSDEKPQFEVELPDYYIGLACVTNEQYLAFVAATGHRAPDEADYGTPVWSGGGFPAEKAARGPQGFRYPWGDEWDGERCRHSVGEDSEGTCEVWDYPYGVSGYGLYNPGGNVWEWCSDWYEEQAYARYARGDLTPPASGDRRVVRGGSWSDGSTTYFRAACRFYAGPPADRYNSLGFRCVRGL
jgi:formylglycine-generating enzyme required for sulfatase activity